MNPDAVIEATDAGLMVPVNPPPPTSDASGYSDVGVRNATINVNIAGGSRSVSPASGGQVKPGDTTRGTGAGASGFEAWLQKEAIQGTGIKNWHLVAGTGGLFAVALIGGRRR
jgi:hypothetical protein